MPAQKIFRPAFLCVTAKKEKLLFSVSTYSYTLEHDEIHDLARSG